MWLAKTLHCLIAGPPSLSFHPPLRLSVRASQSLTFCSTLGIVLVEELLGIHLVWCIALETLSSCLMEHGLSAMTFNNDILTRGCTGKLYTCTTKRLWEIFSLISPYTKSTQLSLTVHRFIPHPSLNSYRSPENYKSENVSDTFLTTRSKTSKRG